MALLARLKQAPEWPALLARIASRRSVSADLLDTLISQIFVMTWGRRLASIRLCLAVLDRPVRLVTDLPRPIVAAFAPELAGRAVEAPLLSLPLRVIRTLDAAARLLARHALRFGRMMRLPLLPSGEGKGYIAWLGALPSEMATTGSERFSLRAFLSEARERMPALELVVQGAPPAAADEGIVRRRSLPPLRYRPSGVLIIRAFIEQWKQAVDSLAHLFDFRHTTLLGPALVDVPALRLWFEADPPRAVLYANHQIGGEPAVALLKSGVPSEMVFYSANVAYRPSNVNAPGTSLEPEMRHIIADRLTMWSPEMTEAFRGAGYAAARLVETGPAVFGRQGDFRPTSRYLTKRRSGPTRLGVFDVAVLRPESRFAAGYGLLTYNHAAAARFFSDVFEAALRQFGGDVVIVRKAKRAFHPTFGRDVDFGKLPAVTIELRDPAENLWRVLETVDLVVCMPFTSVAYIADESGIPAAYYDAGQSTEPSLLGGRVPILSSPERLEAWFGAPIAPSPRLPRAVAEKVVAAAIQPLDIADPPHRSGRVINHVVHT